jgi:hypothetical protein
LWGELKTIMEANTERATAPSAGRNRRVYRLIKGRIAQSRLEALIPMEWAVFRHLREHPMVSAQQVAEATGMNGKSVESALYRLRAEHHLIESVPMIERERD